MQVPIEVVSAALVLMTWHGRNLNVLDAATREDQEELLAHLHAIDPDFDYENDSTAPKLKKSPHMLEKLDTHTLGSTYVWQYFKDPQCMKFPDVPLKDTVPEGETFIPEAADSDVFPLRPVPAPVPVSELAVGVDGTSHDKKFAPFEVLQHFHPDHSHAPSQAKRFCAVKPSQFRTQQVRGMIECQECGKQRAFYCEDAYTKMYSCPAAEFELELDSEKRKKLKKTNHAGVLDELDRLIEDDPQFVCGASLFPPGHDLSSYIITRPDLQCSSHMETELYKLKDSIKFDVSTCGFCGVESVPEQESQFGDLPRCEECLKEGAPQVRIMSARGRKRGAGKIVRATKKKARVACEAEGSPEGSPEPVISDDSADEQNVDIGSDDEWAVPHVPVSGSSRSLRSDR